MNLMQFIRFRLAKFISQKRPVILPSILGLCLALSWGIAGSATSFIPGAAIVKIYNYSLGSSTRYIGACEGNINFDLADMLDLGVNTYRIYGGMSRWEPDDDDGVYGLPTISQIKDNPDLIPWRHWDAIMTSPKTGSDYAFSGSPEELWQGSARTIFETLRQGHIRPVLTIRNTDPGWNPAWALQLNPPRTEADWNEWWEHVFATVYWLNVRNDYRVNDFEIHNEPDNRQQGWGGNQKDYFELVRVASDAIAYIYATYLPGRSFHIHTPQAVEASDWTRNTLATIPTYFDHINIHTYDWDISADVQQVRSWMHDTIHARSPLWLGEWGSYSGGYDDLTFSLNLIKNMIRMSQPGETYVYGSHIFSLYDWSLSGGFEGLVSAAGDRRLSYYAFRMGIRALQGGRPVFPTASSVSDIMAITTQDAEGSFYFLMVNDHPEPQHIVADISSLLTHGVGTVWELSAMAKDDIVGHVAIEDGEVMVELPAYTSRLLILSPTVTPQK